MRLINYYPTTTHTTNHITDHVIKHVSLVQLVGLPAGAPLRGARILVGAHTNTAVDRVLTGLKDAGYTGEV